MDDKFAGLMGNGVLTSAGSALCGTKVPVLIFGNISSKVANITTIDFLHRTTQDDTDDAAASRFRSLHTYT